MLTSCSIDIYKPIHVQCVIYLGKIPPHFYGIAQEVRIIPSPESLLGNLRAEDRMTKMISVLATEFHLEMKPLSSVAETTRQQDISWLYMRS